MNPVCADCLTWKVVQLCCAQAFNAPDLGWECGSAAVGERQLTNWDQRGWGVRGDGEGGGGGQTVGVHCWGPGGN